MMGSEARGFPLPDIPPEGESYCWRGTGYRQHIFISTPQKKTHIWRGVTINLVKKTGIHLGFCFPLRGAEHNAESPGNHAEVAETLGGVASSSLAPALPLYCWFQQALTDWLSWEVALSVFHRFSRQKLSILKVQCSLQCFSHTPEFIILPI